MFINTEKRVALKALFLKVLFCSAFLAWASAGDCATQEEVDAFVNSLTAAPGCTITTRNETQNGQQVIQVIQNCAPWVFLSIEQKLINESPVPNISNQVTATIKTTKIYCNGQTTYEYTVAGLPFAMNPYCYKGTMCEGVFNYDYYPQFHYFNGGDCSPYETGLATFYMSCAIGDPCCGDPNCGADPDPDPDPDCHGSGAGN